MGRSYSSVFALGQRRRGVLERYAVVETPNWHSWWLRARCRASPHDDIKFIVIEFASEVATVILVVIVFGHCCRSSYQRLGLRFPSHLCDAIPNCLNNLRKAAAAGDLSEFLLGQLRAAFLARVG